jgi:hypothetical protein
VSSSPLVGSAIAALIDYGIQIGTKSTGIDSRSTGRCFGKRGSGREPARLNGPQFCDRRTVAGHYDRSPRLHLAKYRCGLIA